MMMRAAWAILAELDQELVVAFLILGSFLATVGWVKLQGKSINDDPLLLGRIGLVISIPLGLILFFNGSYLLYHMRTKLAVCIAGAVCLVIGWLVRQAYRSLRK